MVFIAILQDLVSKQIETHALSVQDKFSGGITRAFPAAMKILEQLLMFTVQFAFLNSMSTKYWYYYYSGNQKKKQKLMDQEMAPADGATDTAQLPDRGQLTYQGNRIGPVLRDPDCDPLAKRELIAQQARDTKRREIRSTKRIANLTRAAALDVEIMLLNIRGINTHRKQVLLAQEMKKRAPRIMVLTETKLTRIMGLDGYDTHQTQKNRGGGCWIGAAAGRIKPIKTFSNAINWVKATLDGHNIHVIAMYMTPGKKERQEHDTAQLDHILGQLSRSPFGHQQVIVMGDFNEALGEVTTVAAKHGLVATVPTGTATHWKGGHLDQIFSNMGYENIEVSPVDKRVSDHSKIMMRVKSSKETTEKDLTQRRNNPSQAWIRRQANKEETIKLLLERGSILETPAKLIIDGRKVQETRRWYQPRPKGEQRKTQGGFLCEGTAMSRQEWAKTMKLLESLHKQGEWKEFYDLINKVTKLKKGSCPVKAIAKGNEVTKNEEEKDEAIAAYMSELYKGEPMVCADTCAQKTELFSPSDITEAIRESNFSKAIGPDMFDGSVLHKDENLRTRVEQEIAQMLNKVQFPEYFGDGRLTALSKKEGQETVELEDIRPIVIRSHLTKITEKAVLARLRDNHLHLIKTAQSQSGFKKGCSTSSNIAKMLITAHPGRGIRKKTAVLLIDLRKAYDSVNREKLFRILRQRCRNEEDRQMVDIIARLHGKARIHIGGKVVETMRGLAQGSVLAPILFNVYLEEALKETATCWQKYKTGDLLCYADDVMCLVNTAEEAKRVINELNESLAKWDMKINPSKSEILGLTQQTEIEGIKCKKSVKYLGMNITLGRDNQKKAAALQIEKNLRVLKARIWGCNTAVKESIIDAYIRSLLLYFGLPMRAAGIWNSEAIDRVEAGIYRSIHGAPRDIANRTLLNVTQGTTPTSEIIERKAVPLRRTVERQGEIRWSKAEESRQARQKQKGKLYLPKEVASTMLALTKGRTLIYFGKRHTCTTHNIEVDDEHIRKCEHFADLPEVHTLAQKLRTTNLRQWEQAEQAAAVLSFTLLKVRLSQLETSGHLRVGDKQSATQQAQAASTPPQPADQEQQQPNDTEMQDETKPLKRGRGRPRKEECNREEQLQQKGQLSLTFFMKKESPIYQNKGKGKVRTTKMETQVDSNTH